MQQIYDNRAGDFSKSPNIVVITKEENFRCSKEVLSFLNKFRTDVEQRAAGKNADAEGSVLIRLIQAEKPAAPRQRYSDEQLERVSALFSDAIHFWGWEHIGDVKYLFLARQMIARRMGFSAMQRLFTGEYASADAQEEFEKGTHFLLAPFVDCLFPLFCAFT